MPPGAGCCDFYSPKQGDYIVYLKKDLNDCLGFVLLLSCLLLGCATQIKTGTDYDSGIDFKQYQLFSWIGNEPYLQAKDSSVPLGAINLERIKQEIEKPSSIVASSLAGPTAAAEINKSQ